MTGGIAPRQTVRRFLDPELAEIARAAEERYRERFRAYRADFKVEPTRISHLRSVGEGLELALHPDDPASWDWWGDFESGIEVRRRTRFTRSWRRVIEQAELAQWVESETERYLATLEVSR
jgi:hypothetical protein